MVIITGGSGHIGNVLVRHLLDMGLEVGVIDRDPSSDPAISNLPIKFFQGDIRDKKFLLSTFKQADFVCHLAGVISIVSKKRKLLQDVNVEGTRMVTEACLESGVKRLLYTSSIHALHEPKKGIPIIEKLAKVENVLGDYAKTKVQATKIVFEAVKKGLDAIVVYPSGVIGPYDFKNSEMGTLIREASNYSKYFYVDGGYNFVDVRDVSKGIISALFNGKKGEDYLLGGNDISIKQLFTTLSNLTNTVGPRVKVPRNIVKLVVPLAEVFYKVFNKKPLLTKYSVDVLNSNYQIDSRKAEKDLGYQARDIIITIEDTLKWYRGEKVSIE